MDANDVKVFQRINIAVAVFLLVFALVLGFVAFTLRRVRSRIDVDQVFLARAMRDAVVAYLDDYLSVSNSVDSVPGDSISRATPSRVPDLKFADFGTAFFPKSGWVVDLGGSRYRVGDYCEFGLVSYISDDRFYCRNGDDTCVIRRRANVTDSSRATSDARTNVTTRAPLRFF